MATDSKPQPTTDRPWRWLLAPALASLYPVLFLYTQYIQEANERDVVICGTVVVAAAMMVAYLFRFVFSGVPRASLAAVAFVVWSFSFLSYLRAGRYVFESVSGSQFKDYFLYVFWVMLLFAAALFLRRVRCSDRRMGQIYKFVLIACISSIGFAVFQGVHGFMHESVVHDAPASLWESDQEVMPAAWKPKPMAKHRDIYYILLDRFASEQSLQQFFGFDNSEFCNELEKRGFVVDRKAITSYPMTSTSMSSTLNMRYLSPLVEKASDYFASVEANEVGKLLIKAGYTYHFFGNQYDGLRKSSIAQWNMKVSAMPCEFADSLVSLTPFRSLIGRQHKREFVLQKCAAIAEFAKDPAAKFTYAHFLVPHPPYAFARDGSAQSEINRATRPEKELYIDQLVATNQLILQTIDEILHSAAIKPIIILQADEGPYLMAGDETLSRNEQIAKRLGILNAILIPDEDIRQRLPKPLMPVNTFRFLFKEYFGAPIDLLPDRVFYWEKPEPTGAAETGSRIIEVTHEVSPGK